MHQLFIHFKFTIYIQMVDFLVQEDVFTELIGYITQINNGLPRPSPSSEHTPEIKNAYKVKA
jgi:hypothetical protein